MDAQADRTTQHSVLAKSFHWGVALLYAYGIMKTAVWDSMVPIFKEQVRNKEI